MADGSSAPPPRRRWRRRLAILLAALVALAVGLAFAAGPIAERLVVSGLEDAWRVRASVGGLRPGPRGVTVDHLVVAHQDGDPLFALDAAELDLAPLDALRGHWDAELELVGVVLHARRGEDGVWDVATLPRGRETDDTGGEPDEAEPAPEDRPLPDVRVRVRVTDVRLVIEGVDELAPEVALERAELDVEGLDALVPWLGASLAPGAARPGSRIGATVDVERLVAHGLTLGGRTEVELTGDAFDLRAALTANGGTVDATGALASEGDAPAELRVVARDVAANAEVTELFAFLHPAFAQVRELEGEVGGAIDAEVEVSAPAEELRAVLGGSAESFPVDRIDGKGTFAIRDVAITGSPLLRRLREELDGDPEGELRLRPIRFALAGGRVRYANPWTWTLSDTETTFEGSVGLDESLDLVWTVPVTDDLVERYRVLRTFRGETLRVPLGGTASDPELEWSALLDDLAGTALERTLGLGGEEDPAELLARADALWAEGRKAEAAELYHRIREEHKLSLVYTLNRKRIKEREAARE